MSIVCSIRNAYHMIGAGWAAKILKPFGLGKPARDNLRPLARRRAHDAYTNTPTSRRTVAVGRQRRDAKQEEAMWKSNYAGIARLSWAMATGLHRDHGQHRHDHQHQLQDAARSSPATSRLSQPAPRDHDAREICSVTTWRRAVVHLAPHIGMAPPKSLNAGR